MLVRMCCVSGSSCFQKLCFQSQRSQLKNICKYRAKVIFLLKKNWFFLKKRDFVHLKPINIRD